MITNDLKQLNTFFSSPFLLTKTNNNCKWTGCRGENYLATSVVTFSIHPH